LPVDWDQPPGQGGDFDETISRFKDRFKGTKGGGRIILWVVIVIAAVIVGTSSYYTIDPEETGVIQRFGKYVRQTGPGLHFKVPWAEKVSKIKTGRVLKEEFGFRATTPGIRSQFAKRGFDDESLMLSGDLNVIDLKWIVQYRIQQPEKWLFNVRDGRAAIRDLSEAGMRRIVGNRYSTDVLTVQRMEVAALAQEDLQNILSTYDIGVQIVTVKLQDVNPPEPVQPAFNEVNEARQEKERILNQAQAEYNKMIPRAEGQAFQAIAEAEGYALNRINRAKGETERFIAVLKEYRLARDVTRKRLYLEAFGALLTKTKKVYVVDKEQQTLLPLLNLEGGSK